MIVDLSIHGYRKKPVEYQAISINDARCLSSLSFISDTITPTILKNHWEYTVFYYLRRVVICTIIKKTTDFFVHSRFQWHRFFAKSIIGFFSPLMLVIHYEVE